MPIYEYRCKKCGSEFELMRPVAKLDDPAPCTACKSRRTQRKISVFAVHRSAGPDLLGSDFDGFDDDFDGGGHGHDHGGGMDDFGGDDWDDDY